MAEDDEREQFVGLDMRVAFQSPAHATVYTCPERNVVFRIELDDPPSRNWQKMDGWMEMEPEIALGLADKIREVANFVIARRVLRD